MDESLDWSFVVTKSFRDCLDFYWWASRYFFLDIVVDELMPAEVVIVLFRNSYE